MTLFDQPRNEELADLLTVIEEDSELQKGKQLFCAACGHPITDEGKRIMAQNAHEHTCINPHGIVFYIGCFSGAPGCGHVAQATYEYTWFAGYSWQIAVCASCGEHLGWRFRNYEGEGFHGLILARLVAEQ